MLTATLPITAFAQSSVGSTSLDTNIGEDVIQGQHTQYDEVEANETQTQVYLTVEDSDLIVSLPTTVILSGIPDEQGKYIGKYGEGFKISVLSLWKMGIMDIFMHSADWNIRPCIYEENAQKDDNSINKLDANS